MLMINKLSLTVSNSETFETIEISPTSVTVKIFDDYIEFYYFINWRLPDNEHIDKLVRGREISIRGLAKISFDEIGKAALSEDGVHIAPIPNIIDIVLDDAELYEEIELSNKTEYIKNHVIGAYAIMGNESKHLRVF